VVLGIEAGNHRVATADVRQRQHAGRLEEIEPSIGGETEHAFVPLAHVMVGPEQGVARLLVGSGGAVESTKPLDLLEVSSIFPTRHQPPIASMTVLRSLPASEGDTPPPSTAREEAAQQRPNPPGHEGVRRAASARFRAALARCR
jgi:hypothetical protein